VSSQLHAKLQLRRHSPWRPFVAFSSQFACGVLDCFAPLTFCLADFILHLAATTPQAAVRSLKDAGIADDDISLVANNSSGSVAVQADEDSETNAPKGAGPGLRQAVA
jgi:hypothetical protein